jgi:hypothetical protein
MKGCGIGIMGNSITMDVNKTEPKEQVIKLKPVLYKENLVSRVRDDERVTNHFTKKSIKQKSNKMFLIIPKCLAASTALIDPCTHSYYLTVKVCHPQKKCKPIMVDLIHSSGYDVIFNDENIDQDFNENIINHVLNLIDMKRDEINDNTEELLELEKQSENYKKRKDAIKKIDNM